MGKRYGVDIKKIPAYKFGQVGTIEVTNKKGTKYIEKGSDLKKIVEDEYSGGKYDRTFEREVKEKWGLTGSWEDKRKKLLKVIEGGKAKAELDIKKQQQKNIRAGRRMNEISMAARLEESRSGIVNKKIDRINERINRATTVDGRKISAGDLGAEGRYEGESSRNKIAVGALIENGSAPKGVAGSGFAGRGQAMGSPVGRSDARPVSGGFGVNQSGAGGKTVLHVDFNKGGKGALGFKSGPPNSGSGNIRFAA